MKYTIREMYNPQYDIDLLTHDGRSAEDGEQGGISAVE